MYDESSFASGVTLTSDKVACLAKQKAFNHVARRLILIAALSLLFAPSQGAFLKESPQGFIEKPLSQEIPESC